MLWYASAYIHHHIPFVWKGSALISSSQTRSGAFIFLFPAHRRYPATVFSVLIYVYACNFILQYDWKKSNKNSRAKRSLVIVIPTVLNEKNLSNKMKVIFSMNNCDRNCHLSFQLHRGLKWGKNEDMNSFLSTRKRTESLVSKSRLQGACWISSKS